MTKFWKSGLSFECHQCGNCCTFQGGVINASKEEFKRIASFLKISFKEFLNDYTEKVDTKISIKSEPDGPCFFYDKGCTIYDVRPNQCRTYPFWPELLKNKHRWQQESSNCRGIAKGKFWDEKQIKILLNLSKKQYLMK